MRGNLSLPFITPEVEFFAIHTDLVNDVLEIERDSRVGELTNAVVNRTIGDIGARFKRIEEEVEEATANSIRIDWVNTSRGKSWESWGRFYNRMGPKRRLGSLGFMLGDGEVALRLFGWLMPRRGGVDGRRWFVQKCKKQFPQVYLHTDYPDRLPRHYSDCGVIWLDKQLTKKTSCDDVYGLLRRQSASFFRRQISKLKELVEE